MQLVAPLPLQGQAPVAGRPTGRRPYAVTGARFQPVTGLRRETPVYNPLTQTAAMLDGTPLTAMATSQKTNPDGDPKNPPPHDEGADPGVFE